MPNVSRRCLLALVGLSALAVPALASSRHAWAADGVADDGRLEGSDGSDRVLELRPPMWSGSWADVPETDAEGHEIDYTVEQETVSHFEWSVEGTPKDGFHLVDVCTVGAADVDKDAEHVNWITKPR